MRAGFLGAGLIGTYHSKSARRSGIEVKRAGGFDPDHHRAERFATASGHQVRDSAEQWLDGIALAALRAVDATYRSAERGGEREEVR